jgi:hypothetical protein
MAAKPVKIFNAFDLQFGSQTEDHLHIHETIQYCEVRFRVILSKFGRAESQRQREIQRGLHMEMVRMKIIIIHRDYLVIYRPSFCLILGWLPRLACRLTSL